MANLITNGTFTTDLSSWTSSPSGVATQVSGEARIIGQGGSSDQFYQHGFAIANATAYRLTLTARGAVAGTDLRVQLVTHSGLTNLGLNDDITVTTSNASYELNFTATGTTSDARLRFRTLGSTDTFYIDNVVLDVAGSLSANFTGTPLSGNAPLSVTFTDSSTGTPTSWLWEYSLNGGSYTAFTSSTAQNPTQNFTASGTYDIRLTATNGGGSHATTKTSYISVAGVITAGFTGTPTSGAAPLSVTFTDASTATNGITSRSWLYNRNGAGWVEFSTATNPAYNFTLSGAYDIRLTVTGPDGTNSLDRLAYINPTGGVVANFTGTPLSGVIPLSVTFTDSSTGTVLTRTWEYRRNGGAWTEFSSATNPSLSLVQAGTYDIRLTVTGSSTNDTLTRAAYVVTTGDDTIIATFYNELGSGEVISATYAFLPEVDYFITTSYDSATGLAALYVNGEAIVQQDIGIFQLGSAGNDGNLHVGQYNGAQHANGIYDELLLLNRAIAPDEVRAVYESNAPVFAETSTWHWRSGRNRLWSDAEGLWMVNASGTKVIGAYAGDENDANAFKTWGGVNLYESDVLIGDASRGGYLQWDDSAATLQVAGQIVIQAGSTGFSNIPTSALTNDAAWTAGATWGTNINSIPTRFGDAPGAAGLYLTATHLGYYNGSAWKAWIASNGFFYFGGDSGAHLEWNGTKLRGIGTDGSTEQWYANSTDGKLYAGAGAVILDSTGVSVLGQTTDARASYTDPRAVNLRRDTGALIGRMLGYYLSGSDTYGIDVFARSPDAEKATATFGAEYADAIYAGGSAGSPRIVAHSDSASSDFLRLYSAGKIQLYNSGSATPDMEFSAASVTINVPVAAPYVSVGSIAQNYTPTIGNWNGGGGTTLLLNALDYSTIGFHDSGSRVDFIRVGAGLITLGYDGGYGVANVAVGGTLRTTLGQAWDFGSYTTTAPSATGYVTIKINGTTYKLLAST